MSTSHRLRRTAASIFALALGLFGTGALAQAYPSKRVTIVVAFPPGGSTDITARLAAQKLSELWKQAVVVDNKAGAGGNIGAGFVAKSAPDGYTMLLATTTISVTPSLQQVLPFDTVRDFQPVILVSGFPNILVVHTALPVRTPQEFIAYARANPGKLNFASPGSLTGQHLGFELLNQTTGISVLHVPYKGGAPAGQALLAGEVQSMFMNLPEAVPHIKTGKLRAIAATTLTRASSMPELPTLSETVAPGLDAAVWQGVVVPAGTPADVVAKLNRDWQSVIEMSDVKERLAALGMDILGGSPTQFSEYLRDEIAKWRKVVQVAGIKGD